MIPDLTRTELAARLLSSIEGKEAWDYVATNVGLVASAVQFLAPSAGIADAMIADAKRQLGAEPQDYRPLWVHTLPDGKLFGGEPQYGYQALFTREEAEKELAIFGGTVQEYRAYLPSAGAPAMREALNKIINDISLGASGEDARIRLRRAHDAAVNLWRSLAPVAAPVSAADPSDGPSDDKILDALVEALDVDRAGAMKLILRVAGAHLDEREVA